MSKNKKNFLSSVTEALQNMGEEITQWRKIKKDPNESSENRRTHSRKTLEFELIVYCQNRSHRTRTENISRSGLLLKETLPIEFCAKEVDLIIYYEDPKTKNKMRLPLKASVIGAPNISARMSFIPLAADDKIRKDYEYFFDQIVDPPLST